MLAAMQGRAEGDGAARMGTGMRLGSLTSGTGRRIRLPILMYHDVSEVDERSKKARSTNPAYTMSPARFREQAEWLRVHGVRSVGLDELVNRQQDKPRSGRVAITFDDGLENVYKEAFPVLRENGMKAVLFVVTEAVGQPGHAGWGELMEMEEGGVSIESHTASHRPLPYLDPEQLVDELERSKKSIEDRLGKEVQFMSAPHGLIDRRVVDAARRTGYKGICTTMPVVTHRLGEPMILGRINVPDRCGISMFARIVRGDRFLLLRLRTAKRLRRSAQEIIGYEAYRKLYRVWYRIESERR